ncbi:hypothetical protein AOQ73_21010 [Bradyrhizobium pachyrhizi]|nr:hypothetical protein AOQ73_21010 [Bradyrhizobium pachyrhizi]
MAFSIWSASCKTGAEMLVQIALLLVSRTFCYRISGFGMKLLHTRLHVLHGATDPSDYPLEVAL